MMFVIIKSLIPIVSGKRALPMDFKLGIITLTLVISHEFIKPTVMRGLFMWNVFKVKTKLECQVEEYIFWKSKFSVYIAEQQRTILRDFICTLKCKDIAEVSLDAIENYHKNLQTTTYGKIAVMTAIRCFIRFCHQKKLINIKAHLITNTGISKLQYVGSNDTIEVMNTRKRGRPMDIALVKRVYRLREESGEPKPPFRTIALIVKKDLKSTYRLYKYAKETDLLAK